MKIELLKTMTEVGPFAGEVVDYEKAKAVAYVNAGYAKWLPEEEDEPKKAKRIVPSAGFDERLKAMVGDAQKAEK